MLPYRTGRPVLFLAFAGIFLISSPIFAQNPDSLPSIEKKRPNSLKPGAWALQFQISDNFRSFSGLQGFGVSVKYHFSRTNALRFGAGGSLSTSDYDAAARSFQADTVRQKRIGGGRKGMRKALILRLSMLSMRRPRSTLRSSLEAARLFVFSIPYTAMRTASVMEQLPARALTRPMKTAGLSVLPRFPVRNGSPQKA